jgi:hypothetical protein
VLVRRAWGKVAADTVTATVVLYRGTEHEQRLKRQLTVRADDAFVTVDLPAGRRREPLRDAQVAQDVVAQQQIGRAILAQQLAGMVDPSASDSLSQSRGQQAQTGPGQKPGLPFFRSGAPGYQPVISTLPEGTNLMAQAVVSADRRYVRVTTVPLFSGVGQVTQFNFSGGGAQGTGGAGGGGGGMGGGGMGGGGMGGMGGGQGFFSIPPEKTIKVPFRSACLNHGKNEPNPHVEYRLVRTTEYTDDPVLAELIRMVGTGRMDQQSIQAAIWTRTDNLTFEQLANKQVRGIQGIRYYFRPEQIARGRQLMTAAEVQVKERGDQPEQRPTTPARVR